MPEIKNTFTQGKMNKDLDERLLPNGQYKDAMNVQVSTSEGSDVGTVQNVLGNYSLGGLNGDCVGSIADEKNNKLYWFITTNNKDAIYEYSEGFSPVPIFIDTKANTPEAVLEFGTRIITGINIIDDFIFWTDGVTEPKKINITRSKLGTVDAFTHTQLVVNNQVYINNQSQQVDIEKSHITVIKKKPTSKLNVKVVSSNTAVMPSLFEKTLSRFSYRYKYEDGEYSAFGPFTDVIFNPLYPTDVDQLNFFLPKEPYNLAMLNTIESIDVYDFISPDMPNDVVQVDILYKQENSPVVYSIASIKPTDSTGYWNQDGYSQGETFPQNSLYRGKYPITSENIYAALPENQLLRVYDNVPKSAISQEITGSRLVYGNYTQNYNVDQKPEVWLSYGERLNYVPGVNQGVYDFTGQGLRSIKSQRNYQLGVIFGDEYGRETPVFSSTESAVKIPWSGQGDLQASKSNQLKAYISIGIPSWADYYKFYIKQTSSEYYNLIMDRAYTPVEYAEGRDRFDHLWISFASSDRSKITEEDYLILKKNIDGTNDQFPIENRYKILDISNEVPDAIKFKYTTLGINSNESAGVYSGELDDNPIASSLGQASGVVGQGVYPNYPLRMDVQGADMIDIDKSNFESNSLGRNGASLTTDDEAVQDVENLYISWYGDVNGVTKLSKKYRISNIRVSNPNSSPQYVLKLEEGILQADSDIAKHPTDTSATHPRLNETLTAKIERKDEKDLSEFSGRFFVKIVRDNTAGIQQETSDGGLQVFSVIEEANAYWFADDQTNATDTDFSLASAPTSTHTVATVTNGGASDLTTTAAQWGSLFTHAVINNSRFFIDNMYFAAGQNSSNYYAKNAGDVIAGARFSYAQQTWSNTINTDRHVPPSKAGDYVLDDGSIDSTGTLSSYGSSTNHGWEVTNNSPPNYHPLNKKLNYWPRVLSGQNISGGANVNIDGIDDTPGANYGLTVNADRDNFVRVFIHLGLAPNAWNRYIAPDYGSYIGDHSSGFSQLGWAKYYDDKDKATSRWKPYARDSERGWKETHSNFPPNVNGWFARNNLASTANATYQIPTQSINASFMTSAGLSAGGGGLANCMEGIMKTDNSHTSNQTHLARRKWRQEGDLNTGTFVEGNVYGSTNGKVYLHLSYLGPGQDLVPDAIDLSGCDAFGYNSIASHLQGIWGGGTFVADNHDNQTLLNDPADNTAGGSYIDSDTQGDRLVECEGNYYQTATSFNTGSGFTTRPTSNYYTSTSAPGPGVGQGYNLNYSDHHYNQWSINHPTANNTVSTQANHDFSTAIAVNSKFQFSEDPDGVVYTINSVNIKRMYNHTPWKKRKVWDGNNLNIDYGFINGGDSVEEAAIAWARSKGTPDYATKTAELEQKIKDFGKSNNRRLTFIIELDKDPTDASVSPNFNPVNANDGMTSSTISKIQFTGADTIQLLGRVSSIPAIWETEPKNDSGLDIYYEASGVIPTKINMKNREVFAPVGCKVEIVEADGTLFSFARNGYLNISDDIMLQSWDNTDELKIKVVGRTSDGFNKFSAFNVAIHTYGDKYMRFYRVDGSYTTAKIAVAEVSSTDYRTEFTLESETVNLEAGLSWYNCFSFGNGVESDRIRDDFNEMRITNGARASTTTEEPYEEDHRKYGLIFSGLYNSNSSLNELNQFIMAEKITKDINPTYGSIQKLFSRNTDLVTFCEDRVVKILANKDAVFNADGNPQLTANVNVLGQTIPFIGDYGISKNPESFASSSYRAYFADKQRGAVLRLSKDGLTPISDQGMHDWFRDNLKYAGFVVGSYDAYKRNYNITLKEAIADNLLLNSTISEGTLLDYTVLDPTNYIDALSGIGFDEVTGWFSGSNGYRTGGSTWWQTQPQHVSTYSNPSLLANTIIREYPQIPAGYFQQFSPAGTLLTASSGEVFNTPSITTHGRIAVYGGSSNGFNNVTGSPAHDLSRTVNGVALVDTSASSGVPNNGMDYASASNADANIWHFGQGTGSVTTSPSGGGISSTNWSTLSNGIAFQSYPDLSATTPVSLDPDTSFVSSPSSYGNSAQQTTTRDDFFAGTEILDSTATVPPGLFENTPSGALTMPNTMFNGEEINILIGGLVPPYGGTAHGASDATNGPTVSGLLTNGDTAPDTNKPGSGIYKAFEIKLHEGTPASDGSTVISSSLLMDPTGGYPSSVTNPYTERGSIGSMFFGAPFSTSSTTLSLIPSLNYVSPHASSNQPITLLSYFKFTNGTENAEVVVEDLQVTVHVVYTDSAGNKYTDPKLQIGSVFVNNISIVKSYRLEDFTTASVTQQADVPAIPATTIPAWTEVVIPDYPNYWSSQSPQYGGSSPVPPRDYFEMLNTEAQFGLSNPPITQSQNASIVNTSTGVVSTTGTVYNWYEGANNGTTGYQDTYTTPNEIYDLATDTFITQTVDDGSGTQVPFPKQDGIYETVRIKAQTMNSNWTNFRLDIVNSNTNDKLEIGAWYCIDVFADESGVGLAPETNGTWSPNGQGEILVYDVCNTNLVLDSNDELNWGTGGSTNQRYPVGHLGKIIKGDTIAVQSWYGGNIGDNIPRRHIALEYYKPNMRDSSVSGSGSGSVWTLAEGTERNNIGETTHGNTWNVGNPSYRAIFQNHPNSHAAKASNQSGQNYLNLVFRQCDIDVRSIVIVKIQSPTNTDPANNGYGGMLDATPNLVPTISSSAPWITHTWWRSAADNGSDFSGFNHGLKDPKCYYLENQGYGGLNFDGYAYHTSYDGNNIQDKPGASAAWIYYFSDHPYANPAGSLNSPQESTEGWELAFEVNKGVDKFGVPRANIEGSFNGRVTNKVGDAPNGTDFGGFEFGNIQHDGHYKVTGNMNGSGPYEILYKGPHSSTPTHYVNYNTVVSNAQIVNIGVINTWMSLDNSAYAARVYFNSQGQAPFAFVGAIKDVTLKNNTDWFTGGSIDAWSFQGFNPVDDDFIFFDNQTNPQNSAIGFNNTPSTTVVADRVQVQQVISNVTYGDESYLIEFEYDITGGEIECYYFNNNGDGFRTSPVTGSGYYSTTHTVGGLDVNTGLPLYTKHNDELVNTFVIFASSGTVSGTVDTLSMKQMATLSPRHMYDTPDDYPDGLAPATLTYDESVKGWVSFKSYIPEQGLSLAKKYYTIKSGGLYEHHAQGVSRNQFYSNFIESSLTAMLNQEPSTIKMFNTLNYEGSQSKVDQYIASGDLSNIDTYNLQAKSGWYANYIQTDKQSGSIKEFIEKEGKWFNYIKGVSPQDTMDTAEFSFQGLGIVSSVINTAPTNL